MSVHPDITACSRSMLARLLDGAATDYDRRMLRGCVDTPIQHDPTQCVLCIHEAAVGVPALIEIRIDPSTNAIYALTDEGVAQGNRCAAMLQEQFDRYPKAREYARAISGAMGKLEVAHLREAIVALAGAIHRIVTKSYEGTL